MKQHKIIQLIISLALMYGAVFLYFSPAFNGKTLPQGDITQWKYMAKEAIDLREDGGNSPLWNSRMFGGMPAYQISGVNYQTPVLQLFFFNKLPHPANILFLLLFCSFIMFLCFNVKTWLASIGSFAYALSSYNLILIEAGHNSKATAIALAPLVIGGLALLWRKKYLLGTALTAVGMSMQIGANHLQITYYLGLIIAAWFISELIIAIKEKGIKHFFTVAALALSAALLGLASNAVNLLLTQEYMKETIRGKTELSISADQNKKEDVSSGLDRDYAFQWSQGTEDLPTFIIPNFAGGGSSTYFGTKSETFDALKKQGNPQAKQIAEQYPLAYWGSLPFTSGPEYYGAIVMFLFVLGFFLIKGKHKWWFLIMFILSLFMSMGKNFSLINNLLFDYLPLYNKFRSVNMALVIAQILAPLFAILSLHQFLSLKENSDGLKSALLKALYATGGFCTFALLFAGAFDPSSANDGQLGGLVDAVKADRIKLIRLDAIRSLVFIAIGFGSLWFLLKGTLKKQQAILIIGIASLVDLWSVDRRFIDSKSFVKTQSYEQNFQPTEADLQILKDTTNYRVFDGTVNAFNNARVCYFHRSVGGYHAAKLRRFQDVIEFHIMKNNMRIMNMLNAKYIIQQAGENGPIAANPNPNALGNAWFVNQYKMVKNADEEILALNDFNPATEAIVDQRYASQIGDLNIQQDANASIEMTYFSPDTIRYQYKANSDQLAVFSEIYYNSGKGWQAYINGEKAEHFRCNYILRGMKLPAGNAEITFIFEPASYALGTKIAGFSSIAVIILLAAGIAWSLLHLMRGKEAKKE